VTAGQFQAETDPATGFYSMMVLAGTYDMTAEAPGYVPVTVTGVEAQNYQVVEQDFYLYPYCDFWSDDVESGNLGWTADAPWAITAEASHSPTHSWTDSPGGLYGNNLNISLTSPLFDFTDHSAIGLSFWHIYDIQYYFDFGYVEYSADGGVTWGQAAAFSNDQQNTWTEVELPLPALDNQPDARIRFRLKTTPWVQQDGWHIDDIVLSGSGPSCVTPLAPTAEFGSNSPVQLGEAMLFANQTLGTPPLDYLWDFGDGAGTSTEVNPSYTYPQAGTYNVTLTATNAWGSDSVSHPVTVEGPADVMHVHDIRLRYQDRGGGRYLVLGSVRILDQDNQRVAGATVSAEWTLPNGQHVTQQATTNAQGMAQFRVKSTQVGSHELCVTDVAKAGWSYDPDQNAETCDSLAVP
jgi:PKD repeat protein